MRMLNIVRLCALILGSMVCAAGAPAARAEIAYITGGSTIYRWDTSTNAVTTVTTASGSLDSLIFDGKGDIIYDAFYGNYIGIYNLKSHSSSVLVTRAGPGPADLALDPGGASFLVSNAADGSIDRVDIATGAVTHLYTGGLRPDGLAYDDSGHLFAVLGLKEVAQLDPTTGAVLRTISTPNAPDGLTFDSTTHKLYVGSDGGGFYTVSTDLSRATFTNVNNAVIDGVASTGDLLYLVQRGQGALQYNLSTNSVTATSPHIAGADDIAPLAGLGSPVPEPNSLILIGFGLGTLAVVSRRKGNPFRGGSGVGR